jgi:hypothetical protein
MVGTKGAPITSSRLIDLVDYAVLIVAIHSALQIFRSAERQNSDGLYEYRTYIFLGAFVLPFLMAGLAFVNAGPAYEFLGALCQLPIRPFWYRLALAWVPRYLIGSIILSLAGAIYAYVGCEFRSYAHLSQSRMTSVTTTLGLSLVNADVEAGGTPSIRKSHSLILPDSLSRASSIADDVVSHPRAGSGVAFGTTTYAPITPSAESNPGTKSLPGSSNFLPLTRSASIRPSLLITPSRYVVKRPPSAHYCQAPPSPLTRPLEDPMATIASGSPAKAGVSRRDCSPPSPTQRRLHRQRRRVHHQLRLMFVYPLVYILMWLVPFIYNILNYNNHYANHPIFFIRIGQIVCLTSMGFVNSLIFCLREKPWRSILMSGGTLWGSLALWSSPRTSGSTSERGKKSSASRERSWAGSASKTLTRVRNSVRTSANADHTRRAAERARNRLDIEKVERLAAMTQRMERGRIADKKGKERIAE